MNVLSLLIPFCLSAAILTLLHLDSQIGSQSFKKYCEPKERCCFYLQFFFGGAIVIYSIVCIVF
jgi:hypothetical protein